MKKAMKKTLKVLAWVAGIGVVLAIVAFSAVIFYLDSIVQKSVTVFGSEMTGTKVQLEKVSISILRPKVVLEKFSVGNPSGYKNPNAFDLTMLQASVQRESLMSDKIVINEILIDGAMVDFEPQLTGDNNLSDIKKNIEKKTKASETAEKAETTETKETKQPEEKKSKKTVMIKLFRMTNCKITITSKLLADQNITIPLPDIEMTDIGGDDSSPEQVMEEIYDTLFKDIVLAVKNSAAGVKLPEAFDQIDKTSKDVLDKTKEEGSKVLDSIKNIF